MTVVAIGLGSNMPHGRFGRPREVVRAAVVALQGRGITLLQLSPIIATAPLGPSHRRYANAVLKGSWSSDAVALFHALKSVEREFGRRAGRRWGARVLDCDLLVFGSQSIHHRHPWLQVPHSQLAQRNFVLQPLAHVWPGWRHPLSGLTVRQMQARLNKPRAVD